MSGGFSFPPPPPPPPKPTPPTSDQPQYNSQKRSGRGGRVGNRGRGRGGGLDSANQQLQGGLTGLVPPTQYNNSTSNFNFHPRPGSSGPNQNDIAPDGTPNRTFAGQKRKLDALRGPPPPRSQPAPPTAPVTPSFGSSLIRPSIPAKVTSRKPPPNSLGLTPAATDQVYSSSDEGDESNDLDEESLYAELGNKLTFEHNGTILALKSPADLAKWQQERKRNFPTQARVAEKQVERRKIGEERRRLLADAAALNVNSGRTWEKGRNKKTRIFTAEEKGDETKEQSKEDAAVAPVETEMQKAKRSVTEKAAELDRLRQKVVESQERARQAKEKKALEDAAAAEVQGADAVDVGDVGEVSSGFLSESSVISSDSEGDEDGPPEEAASKPVPRPAGFKKPCRYFAASGYCRDGDSCRFFHDPMRMQVPATSFPESNATNPRHSTRRTEDTATKRKGIFERLMEQEQNDSDRLALNVIKYLGGKGFFKKDDSAVAGTE